MIPFPAIQLANDREGGIQCQERLGGLLKYYERGKPPEFVNRMHKGEVVTKPRVIDRGDGPKIEGTRITVYTVLEYLRAGRTRDRIVTMFKLSSDQVQMALDDIRDHDAQVNAHTTQSWPVSSKATRLRLKRPCKPTAKRSKPAWPDSRLHAVSMQQLLSDHDV